MKCTVVAVLVFFLIGFVLSNQITHNSYFPGRSGDVFLASSKIQGSKLLLVDEDLPATVEDVEVASLLSADLGISIKSSSSKEVAAIPAEKVFSDSSVYSIFVIPGAFGDDKSMLSYFPRLVEQLKEELEVADITPTAAYTDAASFLATLLSGETPSVHGYTCSKSPQNGAVMQAANLMDIHFQLNPKSSEGRSVSSDASYVEASGLNAAFRSYGSSSQYTNTVCKNKNTIEALKSVLPETLLQIVEEEDALLCELLTVFDVEVNQYSSLNVFTFASLETILSSNNQMLKKVAISLIDSVAARHLSKVGGKVAILSLGDVPDSYEITSELNGIGNALRELDIEVRKDFLPAIFLNDEVDPSAVAAAINPVVEGSGLMAYAAPKETNNNGRNLLNILPGGDNPDMNDITYFQIFFWSIVVLACATTFVIHTTHSMETGIEKLLEA